MWEGLGSLLLCLLMVSSAPGPPPRRPARELDATPRTTIPYEELSEARHFGGRAHNYSTLLLEEASGRLLVGARGALFSLNAQDIGDGTHREIRWEASPETQSECVRKGRNNQTECFNHVRFLQRLNATHLYACGTHAFQPLCAAIDSEAFTLPRSFEEGKEKCPYDPARGYTGLIIDGGLYTATRYEFRSIPDIRRSRHPRSLRTEESPLHWLNDAEFVFSVLIRESEASTVGDDDKVYYFFTERATEEGSGFSQSRGHRVARVARVCKGDLGGKKILQKKWTSFLKARLACHVPLYETLRSVCSLDGGAWAHTRFYAAFSLAAQWRTLEASAICRYDLSDIQASFSGPYMEYLDGTRRWGRYDGAVPEPRPGSCITDGLRRRGYNSSQDLPSPVLDFVKLHPLMARGVGPARGRPLLLKRNARYTRLVGTPVTVPAGPTYDVLFLGTVDGWIHKAVVLGLGMHIIEEAQAFLEPQPVESLVISAAQHSLYVGAPGGVVQMPLSRCSRYSSCYDCILARDPYCGWDPRGRGCREAAVAPNRTALIQDMERGNRGCEGGADTGPHLPPRNRSVLRGDDVLLPCDQPSNLARASWLLNGSRVLMDGRDGYRVGVDGLLVMDTRPEQSGHYSCYAEENGLRTLLASYGLTVQPILSAPALAPGPPPPSHGAHLSPDVRLLYVLIIAALGGLCLVLASMLLYVVCLRGSGRRRKYSLARGTGRAGGSAVQLQTVSGQCPGDEDEGEEGTDRAGGPEGGGLRIIPGEGTPAPPPPPPPPPPAELSNGLAALPSRLRRMNGNSYVLLQQSEDRAPTLPCSFTEELSRILEKRKHTQLVERLDESSV
ncbi:semaphorin-4G [Monodelphis domestica]|uniref:semaphorin-4G n=1 Tax=Monodelphis domestica TaxID=13616 RepID=UPI0024E23F67|nr:semaphorin-4G [Monodelphis domestica]XP_016283317.2 semaphorin-4G [Monodelphis domestica]XP_016283318.2 semaphorin-4G [Monodelphis domestica]XP_016283319.2 semaphorin-4G [Monodelphis domestica]